MHTRNAIHLFCDYYALEGRTLALSPGEYSARMWQEEADRSLSWRRLPGTLTN